MAKSTKAQPFGILIAALGGEGGGVLANWIVKAVSECGYYVQSTSLPGVAQRTGGTTYFIEFYPVPISDLGDQRPNLSLTPMPGRVDVVLASELIEAARTVQNGFVDPKRTTLIASSHRVFAIAEKAAMGDGTFDIGPALKACNEMAKRAVLFDMEEMAAEAGTVISSVLLGGLAGTGVVPIDPNKFEEVISNSGRAAKASLAGFRLGYDAVTNKSTASTPLAAVPDVGNVSARLRERLEGEWPIEAQYIGMSALARLTDYQNEKYAGLFLDRMAPIVTLDKEKGGARQGWNITKETARYLALRMSYEDIMRVAYLKTRKSRYDRIRDEALAKNSEPVQVREYLKPGPEELCAILPEGIGNWLLNRVRRNGNEARFHVGMHVRSDTITGFITMRLLAALRRLRKTSWRFKQETRLIESWLATVQKAGAVNYKFGVEVAECARLIKGYGNTYRRGLENFNSIMDEIVAPALSAGRNGAKAVAEARDAALADSEGKALAGIIPSAGPVEKTIGGRLLQ